MENKIKDEQLKSIAQQDFKEKIFSAMKENLIFSLLSFLFAKVTDLDNEIDRKKFQKDFINFWKKSVNEVTQHQLSTINNILNENDVDMINIITGENNIADVEEYQSIINASIKDVEGIFWKICGEEK